MEGDVDAILPRPTLPPPSPSLNDPPPNTNNGDNGNKNNSNAVHRYASRDLRTREAQAEIEKWDAWHACAGMSRTEAKRRYISTLIETMKEYASGTQESRELVSELEFVWGQIQNQSQSAGSGSRSGSGGDGDGERESPRRSGVMKMDSFTSDGNQSLGIPPGSGRARPQGLMRNDTTDTRLRVLSPVSQRDSDDIVEGEEDPADDGQVQNATGPERDPQWRASIEAHLRSLSTEIAALREQLSANHLLSSSGYTPYTYQQLSLKWKIWYRISSWIKWTLWSAVRQMCVSAVLLGVLIVWGRWKGDRRVEEWARRRWKEVRGLLGRWAGTVDVRGMTRFVRFGGVGS